MPEKTMSKLTILSTIIAFLLMGYTEIAIIYATILLIPEALKKAFQLLGIIQEQPVNPQE